MRWIKFMYDKDGEFSERLGLEFGPASRGEGNVAVYQKEPVAGFRTFKASKMHEVQEVVSPWQASVYRQRLARLRAPLYTEMEKMFLWYGWWFFLCLLIFAWKWS